MEDDHAEAPVEEGAPAWMATFGDLMSLLLCFFVLLLSFASMDAQKFRAMAGSMHDAFGVPEQFDGPYQALSTTPIELSSKPASDRLAILDDPVPSSAEAPASDHEAMQERVEQMIRDDQLGEIMEAVPDERGVRIRVKGRLLFDPGSGTLRPQAFPFLDEVAELAEDSPYVLAVEGHTDDVPIETAAFPSNWHLSSARAIAALRYLVDVGGLDPSKVSAAAYAGTRPIGPNASEEQRAANRRVEFVFQR